MGIFTSAKEKVLENLFVFVVNYASKPILNKLGFSSVADIAKVKNVKIDTVNKNITAVLLLNGETEDLIVDLIHYEFFNEGNNCGMRINSLNTSRTWINQILSLVPKPIIINNIPKAYVSALNFIL